MKIAWVASPEELGHGYSALALENLASAGLFVTAFPCPAPARKKASPAADGEPEEVPGPARSAAGPEHRENTGPAAPGAGLPREAEEMGAADLSAAGALDLGALERFDIILYCLGNAPESAGVLAAAQERPGVLLLEEERMEELLSSCPGETPGAFPPSPSRKRKRRRAGFREGIPSPLMEAARFSLGVGAPSPECVAALSLPQSVPAAVLPGPEEESYGVALGQLLQEAAFLRPAQALLERTAAALAGVQLSFQLLLCRRTAREVERLFSQKDTEEGEGG